MTEFQSEPVCNLWDENAMVKRFGVFSKLKDEQIKTLQDFKHCQDKTLYKHKCAQLEKEIQNKQFQTG